MNSRTGTQQRAFILNSKYRKITILERSKGQSSWHNNVKLKKPNHTQDKWIEIPEVKFIIDQRIFYSKDLLQQEVTSKNAFSLFFFKQIHVIWTKLSTITRDWNSILMGIWGQSQLSTPENLYKLRTLPINTLVMKGNNYFCQIKLVSLNKKTKES